MPSPHRATSRTLHTATGRKTPWLASSLLRAVRWTSGHVLQCVHANKLGSDSTLPLGCRLSRRHRSEALDRGLTVHSSLTSACRFLCAGSTNPCKQPDVVSC